MEEANLWEIKNCYDENKIPDFGDYEQLAKKIVWSCFRPNSNIV